MNKDSVINWFLNLGRDMLVNPKDVFGRSVTNTDLAMWSAFQLRMTDIAESIGFRFAPYDITRLDGRVWKFSPSGFLLWMSANYALVHRVPELSIVVDAYDVLRETTQRASRVHPAKFKTSEGYEKEIAAIYNGGYRQMVLGLKNFNPEDSIAPASNTGVKNNGGQ